MTQYHLWLTSEGEGRDQLAEVIAQLSLRFKSPSFEPHITLLSGIKGEEHVVCEQAKVLARSIKPFSVNFLEIGYEEEYFRCLYLHVEKTSDILNAQQRASILCEKILPAVYRPHVSLLYGIVPLEVKRDIIRSLPADLPQAFSVVGIQVIRTESADLLDWKNVQSCHF